MNVRILAPAVALAVLAAAPPPPAQDVELENLGKTLVEKRTRVDALSGELEMRRNEVKDRSRAASLQRADLERQITALKLELLEAEDAVAKNRKEIAQKEEARASLKPLALRQIDLLQAHVRRALPFKTAERDAELEKLRAQVRKDELQPDLALARLWSAVEDELRLTRENGLYRQSIVLDGEPVLADVARLGMVLLYYRTLDERTGMAVPAGDGTWSYAPVDAPEGKKRILALFDALKKHIRQGFYELPNPYATAPGK